MPSVHTAEGLVLVQLCSGPVLCSQGSAVVTSGHLKEPSEDLPSCSQPLAFPVLRQVLEPVRRDMVRQVMPQAGQGSPTSTLGGSGCPGTAWFLTAVSCVLLPCRPPAPWKAVTGSGTVTEAPGASWKWPTTRAGTCQPAVGCVPSPDGRAPMCPLHLRVLRPASF